MNTNEELSKDMKDVKDDAEGESWLAEYVKDPHVPTLSVKAVTVNYKLDSPIE